MLGAGLFLPGTAIATDSVVLGKGLSNAFVSEISCPEDLICMDSVFIWELEAKRTVAGPGISGRVRATTTQHTEATQQFVGSVKIFVLRPIEDSALRASYGVDYEIVTLSPRYKGNRFCLLVDPKEIGLDVQSVQNEHGFYCFSARGL